MENTAHKKRKEGRQRKTGMFTLSTLTAHVSRSNRETNWMKRVPSTPTPNAYMHPCFSQPPSHRWSLQWCRWSGIGCPRSRGSRWSACRRKCCHPYSKSWGWLRWTWDSWRWTDPWFQAGPCCASCTYPCRTCRWSRRSARWLCVGDGEVATRRGKQKWGEGQHSRSN